MQTTVRRPPLVGHFVTLAALEVLWITLALVRTETTFHLAPLTVTGVLPVLAALDPEDPPSRRPVVVRAMVGAVVTVGVIAMLAAAGAMAGPSLLPFGGAATESLVFAVIGATGGAVIALLTLR